MIKNVLQSQSTQINFYDLSAILKNFDLYCRILRDSEMQSNISDSSNKFQNHEESKYYGKVGAGILEEIEGTFLVVLLHEQSSEYQQRG